MSITRIPHSALKDLFACFENVIEHVQRVQLAQRLDAVARDALEEHAIARRVRVRVPLRVRMRGRG